MSMLRKNFFALSLRLVLGSLMIFAGCSKLFDLRSFLITVQRLDLLPSWMILPVMILIVQSEIWLGMALVVGFRTKIIATLLAALVSLFIIVIAIALVRGTDGDCGCFGSIDSEQLGFGVIIRDTLILSGCLWLSFQKELNVSAHQISK
ncbi:MAG: MauE/DoxX family redox-associated membrane protein [Bacteroidota bacterium]